MCSGGLKKDEDWRVFSHPSSAVWIVRMKRGKMVMSSRTLFVVVLGG
jgi:hypothetical protein